MIVNKKKNYNLQKNNLLHNNFMNKQTIRIFK